MGDIFQREVAAFWTPETGRIWLGSDDSTGSVNFDWDAIWPVVRDSKPRPTMAFMFHTHPHGVERMSSTDRNMLFGWSLALGMPVWFTVYCNGEYCDYLCVSRMILEVGFGDWCGIGDSDFMSDMKEVIRYSYNDEVIP